ncbi:MarR family winged helix-turn-helix transcriptional regulator [Arthrobacter sp. MDT1-48-3]
MDHVADDVAYDAVGDAVDAARRDWARTWPALDVSPADVLARIERLGHSIEEAQNNALQRRGGRLLANRGDFDVLRTLRRAGHPYSLTPSEINAANLVSSAGLSGRLKRLEQEGWVEREVSTTDRRSTLVRLTEEGRRELDEWLPHHFMFEKSLLESLSDDEQRQLASILRKLLAHFSM